MVLPNNICPIPRPVTKGEEHEPSFMVKSSVGGPSNQWGWDVLGSLYVCKHCSCVYWAKE